jgi:hypothetical protein
VYSVCQVVNAGEFMFIWMTGAIMDNDVCCCGFSIYRVICFIMFSMYG